MRTRDGHIRILPLHVANKIAAGEVVERPASVVKELVENALDAGAKSIRIAISQGGRKLVSVQDDGCGMTRDDALLSLERQATSKIFDVGDIEEIDTLGFRGEAIPSIASVSRFTLTTRRHEDEEGVRVEVNAGVLAAVGAAGCPAGTLVEVRDLFCNVPARKKFLKSCATEEGHVRNIFTVHALAHPGVAFSLTIDGREVAHLASSKSPAERIRELFGEAFVESLLPIDAPGDKVSVSGFIERANRSFPSRRDQYVFVNGRPATAPAIAYALREAYPHRQGDTKPAAILFISLPPRDIDVNVHPTKREIRFRDNTAVRTALMGAIARALGRAEPQGVLRAEVADAKIQKGEEAQRRTETAQCGKARGCNADAHLKIGDIGADDTGKRVDIPPDVKPPLPPAPVEQPLPLSVSDEKAKPWAWFKVLAVTEAGFVLLETDSGIVTLNPRAARERIAYERLIAAEGRPALVQNLLIPEMVRVSPADFTRLKAFLPAICALGFGLEAFGENTFKVDAVPQLVGDIPPGDLLATIAQDIATGTSNRSLTRWREELAAKAVARLFAGVSLPLDQVLAEQLVEELVACRMPYVCPRGKSIMVFTSNRELDRKFGRE